VTDNVETSTKKSQHPNYAGQFTGTVPIADLSKPGVQITHRFMLYDSRRGEPLAFASAASPFIPEQQETSRRLEEFQNAIDQRRLLPGEPSNAFSILDQLKNELAPQLFADRQNELRIALEERAQEVLLRYLAGDQVPQTQADFASAGRDMEVARQLTPESLFLEGREDFFRGRSLLFDKQFPQAAALLEEAVRFDPSAGYPYNALGIAYLEQAQFDKAIPAFRDAAHRAQHWAYPLHNLALAYVETGDYAAAIRSYQEARRLAPKVSYLPYNLGLVYQRIGRLREAEASYRTALALAPDSAEPYNALGTLKASQHKTAEAERLYRQTLEKNPKLIAARGNLALLLSTRPGGFTEAVSLWRENLSESPENLPSRLSLAAALATNGQVKDAIVEYQTTVTQKPDYVAARVALAKLLSQDGRPSDALVQWQEAAKRQPDDFATQEAIGDLELAAGNQAAARAAFSAALQAAPDSRTRKSIRAKLNRTPGN